MRYIILLTTLLLTSMMSMAQDTVPTREIEITDDGIIVTYNICGSYHQDDLLHAGKKFWKIPGFSLSDVGGTPSVPFRWDTFVIPDDVEVSVCVIDSAYTDTLFSLAPSFPPLPMSDTIFYTPDRVPDITPYSGFYPTSAARLGDIQFYRGQGLAKVATTPVQYNYQTNIVRSFSMVKYMLSFSSGGAKVRGHNYVSERNDGNISLTDHFLENNTINYSLSGNGRKNVARTNGRSGNSLLDNRDYLIITTDNFLDAVNEFAEWKRTKGFKVTVITRTTGQWTPEQVKSIVNEAYRNLNLKYLLLVGDIDFIPAYIQTHTEYNNEVCYYPSDLPYVCVNDEFDFTPDILYGRIPVTTNNEANDVFNKIIEYEQNPAQYEDFYSTMTCCSVFQGYDDAEHLSGSEVSRAILSNEEIIEDVTSNGITANRIYTSISNSGQNWTPRFYNNTYFYDGSPLGNSLVNGPYWYENSTPIRTAISNAINNGTFLFSYIGHGEFTKWDIPSFNMSDISSLTNNGLYPVIFSMSCETGRFDYVFDCIAEHFLKKANGGAVAVFAPMLNTSFGYTEMLDEYCIDAIWPNPGIHIRWKYDEAPIAQPQEPVYELGAIINQAMQKMSCMSLANTDSIKNIENYPAVNDYIYNYKLCRKMYHLLGDPSMMIYTDLPGSVATPSISYSNGTLSVSTTDGDARISFYSNGSPNTVDSYIGSTVNYATNADSITICIDRHNCIPYVVQFNKSNFIQNETIDDNRYYYSESTIKVGKNVTTTKPEGNVLIDGANVVIMGNSVELRPGTTITNSNVRIN